MHLRVLRSAFFVVVIVLLAGLLAGCGGGGQPEGGSQEGGSGGSEQQNGGGGSAQQGEGTGGNQETLEVKIALGTVASVTPDENRLTLSPSADEQGTEPIVFRIIPSARITVDNQEAELSGLKEGQHAKVRYVTVDGTNRARAVEVVGG